MKVVIGGGPVGSLLSLYLKKMGFEVSLFEKRQLSQKFEGRSINLVVTAKGINGLEKIGLWEKVYPICVPVKGRTIHQKNGDCQYQSYSKDDSEKNYSVSRNDLNVLLLQEAVKAGVSVHFGHQLQSVDFSRKKVTFKTMEEIDYEVLYGADGVNSEVRKELMNFLGTKDRFVPLKTGYKELFIPRCSLDPGSLHIWPRNQVMLMALPNLDHSFTATLYLPDESLNTREAVKNFFEELFPDACNLIPNYLEDFFKNPTGHLGTVYCSPWHYKDEVLLIGDAAHAIVPFFGQGMNAGFDDCFQLMQLMENQKFQKFFDLQKPNADAIATMAIENFQEMSEKVADPFFLKIKEIEGILGREFPQFFTSRYSMIVHSLIPYAKAKRIGEIQEKILREIALKYEDLTKIDFFEVKDTLQSIKKI